MGNRNDSTALDNGIKGLGYKMLTGGYLKFLK
jgi:hypothetical protein